MPYKTKEQRTKSVRQWRERNPDKYREQQERNSRKTANKNRRLKEEFTSRFSCIRCGESHPACIQFHHRDPSQKLFEISKLFITRQGRAFVEEEIKKCDALCANCHAKHHWEERRQERKDQGQDKGCNGSDERKLEVVTPG